MRELAIGTKGEATLAVTEATLAITVGSGSLRVFSTPMLAAVMEAAACEAVGEALEGDETTVGTSLQLQHTAATVLGGHVHATATVTAVNGREVRFTITAEDEAGVVGTAEHRRFLVYGEKFLEKAVARHAASRN